LKILDGKTQKERRKKKEIRKKKGKSQFLPLGGEWADINEEIRKVGSVFKRQIDG